MDITSLIKDKALAVGFDLVGVTTADAVDDLHVGHLTEWLDCGYAADMGYMHRNFEKRVDPGTLLGGAKSVVCVALNYTPETQFDDNPEIARIANFALYEDYHGFMKDRLGELAAFLVETTGDGARFKICVDSVPLLERALAQRAGIGFIGKNRMLINPDFGLQLLLGEIITTVELTPDKPMEKTCGECDKCVWACPTRAIKSAGTIDARKCISYQTIENKGEIPDDIARFVGNNVFGCDRCIDICPYQKFAKEKAAKNKLFKFHPQRQNLKLKDILEMDEKQFEEIFGDSSLKRTGLQKIKATIRKCTAS
ncbi:MAG: tRNA epoxyqueuosine(34) reductase QueG [Planctomycetes bacterium]|nr:tRNA epoxyqueuosine(34) reductase QueG [Planctomycetota bacterium]